MCQDKGEHQNRMYQNKTESMATTLVIKHLKCSVVLRQIKECSMLEIKDKNNNRMHRKKKSKDSKPRPASHELGGRKLKVKKAEDQKLSPK